MPVDPWKHRSDGMKCKTCMWFVPKESSVKDAIDPRALKAIKSLENEAGFAVINVGRCRRHAPTMSGYPVVFVNDWCGDHKLDEGKVVYEP